MEGPKADLHLHQEEVPRLERIVARRQGRQPYDWRAWAQRLYAEVPPGIDRFLGTYEPDATFDLGVPAEAPEYVRAKMVDALEDAAADGAILAEVRFGATGLALRRPEFMTLFREAERQVQAQHPGFIAEAIVLLSPSATPGRLELVSRQLARCLEMRDQGLAGIDFVVSPHPTQANTTFWTQVYRLAERAARAGLGITAHAGEFSTANVADTLRIPGLRRIGHGTHVVDEAQLLDQLRRSEVTVECNVSINVMFGVVPSYEAHPIRQLAEAGIPVTINTDNPLRTWTTIGREYAICTALGFSLRDLVAFTRNAIQASFTTPERKKKTLLEKVS
jgi:adenosine deaminase